GHEPCEYSSHRGFRPEGVQKPEDGIMAILEEVEDLDREPRLPGQHERQKHYSQFKHYPPHKCYPPAWPPLQSLCIAYRSLRASRACVKLVLSLLTTFRTGPHRSIGDTSDRAEAGPDAGNLKHLRAMMHQDSLTGTMPPRFIRGIGGRTGPAGVNVTQKACGRRV